MCDTGRKPGSDLALNNLWLQVIDDGRGLGREELKVVGRLHWSGSAGRGRYLAALRRVVKGAIQSTRRGYRTFLANFEQVREAADLSKLRLVGFCIRQAWGQVGRLNLSYWLELTFCRISLWRES